MKGSELCIVRVVDIAEFPTELGNRCLLLQELGLNAYRNTEEELLNALTESARQGDMLHICLRSSRCRRFHEIFQKGCTPFSDKDPIRLAEYGGRYWVVEGKHRVCLAMRAGVENLKAFVYHLEEDTESLLSCEGKPGRFSFCFSFLAGPNGPEEIQGSLGYLWVQSHSWAFPDRFDFGGAWLDASRSTGGIQREVFQGLQYRVSVDRKLVKRSFFQRRELFVVESEVTVAPDHAKARIWLVEVNAAEVLGRRFARPLVFRTVFRFGCWRQHHLKDLERMLPILR